MASASGGLSDLEKDALAELGNIGAGNATTALSQMLGDRMVRMTSPRVAVVRLAELSDWVGPPDSPVAAVYMRVGGGLTGYVALLAPEASASAILKTILRYGHEQVPGLATGSTPLSERNPADLEASALMEIGNIVITSYLNAMSEMTGLTLVPSVPAVAADMLEAVLASILAEIQTGDDNVLAIQTHFEGEGASLDGQLIFVPGEGQLARLFVALGMTGEEPA
ncbi:MAG: chemotaxis protein CheC [Bacillota bacterium]